MRNHSVFYPPSFLPSFLLLFVALSLMWSCEQEAALQDFEAVPEEMEIAARKAPPGGAAPTTCGGCRLTITAIPTGRTIEVLSVESSASSNYTAATLCEETTPWVSAIVSSVPTHLDYGGDDFIDYDPFRFVIRQLSGDPGNSQISYSLRCFGSSTHGNASSSYTINSGVPLLGNGQWGFIFPAPAMIGGFPVYDCPIAAVCDEEEPLEP